MSLGCVFLVEDDASLRASIEDLLSFEGYRVSAWPDPQSFLDALPDLAPAVLITDMRMPSLSGVQMHALLRHRGCQMPVIYISGESSVQEGIDAMKQGAIEFLVKPFGRVALLDAVAKGMELDRGRLAQVEAASRLSRLLALLTPREREVHGLMLKGYGNADIVRTLGISLATAKQYKSEVLRKLQARSLAELMKLGAESTHGGTNHGA